MSIDSMIECLKREVHRRKKYYPILVESGKMESDYAELEIAKMQAVMEFITNINGIVNR